MLPLGTPVLKVDLNLLRTLDALLSHRSVQRAARHLGRSQPAASHALNRLRATFAAGSKMLAAMRHGTLPEYSDFLRESKSLLSGNPASNVPPTWLPCRFSSQKTTVHWP